jgi:arginine deiminase
MNILDTYLFLIDDNISIHKNVIKEKKLPCFGFFSTHLGKNSFSDQHPARNTKRLGITTEGNQKFYFYGLE